MSFERNRPRASQTPLKRNHRGEVLCRYCECPIPYYRKTFCSDECIHYFRLESDSNYLRAAIFKRDKGICQFCGEDCEKLRAEKIKNITKPKDYFRAKKSMWAVHHIKAVHLGGGVGKHTAYGDLSNYSTICESCHTVITKLQGEQRTKKQQRARFLKILKTLEDDVIGLTTAELSAILSRSKSSLLADIKKLRAKGYVDRDNDCGAYFVTPLGRARLERVSDENKKSKIGP